MLGVPTTSATTRKSSYTNIIIIKFNIFILYHILLLLSLIIIVVIKLSYNRNVYFIHSYFEFQKIHRHKSIEIELTARNILKCVLDLYLRDSFKFFHVVN